MRFRVLTAVALLVAALSMLLSTAGDAAPWRLAPIEPASAVVSVQMGPSGAIDPNRDCQTIRRCNFTRGGSYRGCISAYTCRRCDFVASRCTITGRERVCRQLQCTW